MMEIEVAVVEVPVEDDDAIDTAAVEEVEDEVEVEDGLEAAKYVNKLSLLLPPQVSSLFPLQAMLHPDSPSEALLVIPCCRELSQ